MSLLSIVGDWRQHSVIIHCRKNFRRFTRYSMQILQPFVFGEHRGMIPSIWLQCTQREEPGREEFSIYRHWSAKIDLKTVFPNFTWALIIDTWWLLIWKVNTLANFTRLHYSEDSLVMLNWVTSTLNKDSYFRPFRNDLHIFSTRIGRGSKLLEFFCEVTSLVVDFTEETLDIGELLLTKEPLQKKIMALVNRCDLTTYL